LAKLLFLEYQGKNRGWPQCAIGGD